MSLSQEGKRLRAEDVPKDDFRLVGDRFWKGAKETERYVNLSLMVHKDIFEVKKAPTVAVYSAPGNGYFVCNLPSQHASSSPTCGAWIPTSMRNTGIDRHLEKHGLPGSKTGFEMTASILASGMAYTTLVGPELRKSGVVVPGVPSPPTIRKYGAQIVQSVPENLRKALRGIPVHISADMTPTLDKRELAAINLHFWKDDEPEVVLAGVVEVEGSMTSTALVALMNAVMEVYDIKSVSEYGPNPWCLQIGGCSDSGANAAAAMIDFTTPRRTLEDLPSLKGFSPCYAHIGNLAIKDALQRTEVSSIVKHLQALVKSIRASRALMEAIKEQKIPAPGRFVASRWRSFMALLRYFIVNAEQLANAHEGLAIPDADMFTMRVIYAVLEPLDLFIARAQADVAGDPFLLTFKAMRVLAKLKGKTLRLPTAKVTETGSSDDAPKVVLEYEPVQRSTLPTTLQAWWRFVASRTEERFFSLETGDFEDIIQDGDDESAAERDSEAGVDADDDAMEDDEEGDDESQGRERATGIGKGRFRRYNVLMNSYVLAAFAISPLTSAWKVALAEHALEGDNALGLAGEENTDGTLHALHIRYMYDNVWAQAVNNPASLAGALSGDGGALGLLSSDRSVSPLDGAKQQIADFRKSTSLVEHFKSFFLALAADKVTLQVEKEFLQGWVRLATEHSAWLGKLLRHVLAAPCRSTKCESDFSMVQHILAPRRLRMSRVMIAAYMFCKRARAYVTEPEVAAGRTKHGTRDIGDLFRAPRAAPGPIQGGRSAGGGASTTSAASSSGASSSSAQAPERVDSESDDDMADAAAEEPDLMYATTTTRSGRQVRTLRAADVARSIVGLRRPRNGR